MHGLLKSFIASFTDWVFCCANSSPKGLEWDVIEDLREMHEQWGGMELKATSAYGVRLYQNGSSLVMHYDKVCGRSAGS